MLKKFLPQTLLGRSILILVIPLIVLQLIITIIFYNRHWDTITRHRTIDFVKDITLVVESFEKNKSMEYMMEVARWTKKAGIEVRGSFMIALPGETPELAEQTIKDALKLDPEYAQFSIATPYPGTALYDEIKKGKWGKLTTDNFSEYQGWNVVFLPEGYKNKDEVLKMSLKAFKTFYIRPSYIMKAILNIRSLEDIKRYFKGFKALVRGFV